MLHSTESRLVLFFSCGIIKLMDYDNLSESVLIKKSQKGDTKAFEELMVRSNTYLFHWLLKKTLCENAAEEFLHITYIKCWKNIKKFRSASSFKTWACTISRNIFIDDYRKRLRNGEISIEEVKDAYIYSRTAKNEGYESLKSEDLRQILDNILDKLPKIHRDVLFSFAVEELTYKEISKKLHCSMGTVLSRLYYARKKAKELLINHGYSEYGNYK